jgi:hypothetical protein
MSLNPEFVAYLEGSGLYEYYNGCQHALEKAELYNKFLLSKQTAPAGKFTFQSHFSPAIKYEYIYNILFDMLSIFISCCNTLFL